MKQRTHRLTLTVTFNKPCTRAFAVAAAADTIHGEFYPVSPDIEGHPDRFTVRSIKSGGSRGRG